MPYRSPGRFLFPILLRPGFFLCTLDYEPAKPVHKKHNTHQSTNGPLPCTIEAITRSGTDIPSSRPTGSFSPNVGEEEFSEVRNARHRRRRDGRGDPHPVPVHPLRRG